MEQSRSEELPNAIVDSIFTAIIILYRFDRQFYKKNFQDSIGESILSTIKKSTKLHEADQETIRQALLTHSESYIKRVGAKNKLTDVESLQMDLAKIRTDFSILISAAISLALSLSENKPIKTVAKKPDSIESEMSMPDLPEVNRDELGRTVSINSFRMHGNGAVSLNPNFISDELLDVIRVAAEAILLKSKSIDKKLKGVGVFQSDDQFKPIFALLEGQIKFDEELEKIMRGYQNLKFIDRLYSAIKDKSRKVNFRKNIV